VIAAELYADRSIENVVCSLLSGTVDEDSYNLALNRPFQAEAEQAFQSTLSVFGPH
jgi:hypothetical protein